MESKYVERFWSKVAKRSSDECWLWLAGKDTGGYGLMHCGRVLKNQTAHRISWELAHGRIPKSRAYHGVCVLHRCDVRACVNPAHLFLGTAADNAADMIDKGRHRWAVGEKQGSARLTQGAIAAIREAYGEGATQRELAARFDVSQPTIGRVIRREGWAHIEDAANATTPEQRVRRSHHSAAKLTAADVAEIRTLHAAGASQGSLATTFGVGQSNISLIVNRKNWCDV